jgi:hypothetical protein
VAGDDGQEVLAPDRAELHLLSSSNGRRSAHVAEQGNFSERVTGPLALDVRPLDRYIGVALDDDVEVVARLPLGGVSQAGKAITPDTVRRTSVGSTTPRSE